MVDSTPLACFARVSRWVWIATGCCAVAVLLGIVFYVQTNHGDVKIELSDPAAKVQVQVDGETIAITGLDRPLRLRPGEHGLVVTGDDFETVTQSFTVKRGSDEPLRVTLVPKKDQVPPPAPKPAPKLPPTPSGPLPTITNSIGMQLALIPKGEFLMGSKVLERDAGPDEIPQHRVRITQPFYLGIHEVTQGQFRRFVEEAGYTDGANEWRDQFRAQNDDRPVAYVNWQDATEFCKWLSTKEKQTYRLPTEAEWEYACRAGTPTRFSFGDDDKDLGEYAWFSGNTGNTAHPVGTKKSNAWGLFDMHGNVWEWCADWYDAKYYESSPQDDPPGPTAGSYRVFRGGCWFYSARFCRAAIRSWFEPSFRFFNLGFRLARQFPPSSK